MSEKTAIESEARDYISTSSVKVSQRTIDDVNAIVKRVTETSIENQEQFEEANHGFETIGLLKKTIKGDFKDNISAAHNLHKSLKAQEKAHLEPLEKAESILKSKLNIFIKEQERIIEEAERKAREEAERIRKTEEERILKEAEEAKENGASEAIVDQILKQKVYDEPVEIKIPEKPVFDGRKLGKEIWTFRIVNESIIPRDFLIPNEKKIGQIVRTMKDKTSIPGVEAYIDNF